MGDIVIYFLNGRMLRVPADKVAFARLGQNIDEEYKPDMKNGKAVINWDNVCFCREYVEPEVME